MARIAENDKPPHEQGFSSTADCRSQPRLPFPRLLRIRRSDPQIRPNVTESAKSAIFLGPQPLLRRSVDRA